MGAIPNVPDTGLPANQRAVVLQADNSAVDGGQREVNASSANTALLNNCSGSQPMISITTGGCIIFNSIEKVNEKNSIITFPNPFDRQISIQSDLPMTAILFKYIAVIGKSD